MDEKTKQKLLDLVAQVAMGNRELCERILKQTDELTAYVVKLVGEGPGSPGKPKGVNQG